MTNYDQRIERSETGLNITVDARDLPVPIAREVIQDVMVQSYVLRHAHVSQMATRQERLTLLNSFPTAYWQTGTTDYPTRGGNNASGSYRAQDSEPKSTTHVTWNQAALVAEELAVMVPIPDAYVDDTGAALFDEVRPLIASAMAQKIDAAILFGSNSPFVQTGIVNQAIETGNYVTQGTTVDLASDIAHLGEVAGAQGVAIDSFLASPGFQWKLPQLRSSQGIPIYAPPAQGQPGTIYGLPIEEVRNGQWESNLATLLTGEWDKCRIGIRQDITFSLSADGVIYDPATGNVIYSAFQQDGKILRAVMRIAYVVVNPVRYLGNIFPFFILQGYHAS